MAQTQILSRNQQIVLGIIEKAKGPLKAYSILFNVQKKGINAPQQIYRALDKLIEIGKIQLKMAKGMRSPSAFASVDYSANGNNSDELKEAFKDDWRIGMNMSVNFPLYSGNSLSSAQQRAELEKQKSENDYLTYLNDLRVQVELIRKSIMNYSEIIPINQDVVSSAEEDLKLAQERYSIGSATILEVLDAQVSLIRSNSTLINTIHDARMQEMSLKALLGILDLEYQTKEE